MLAVPRFATLPVPQTPFSFAAGTYGAAYWIDDLNNIQVGGPYAQSVSFRFRARATSTITAAVVYLVGGPGYSAGTNGTIRTAIWTDDGTGKPGSLLATANDLVHPTASAGKTITFPSPPSVTLDSRYHLLFTNVDGSPAANFISVDCGFVYATLDPWQPRYANADYASLVRVGAGAWSDDRGAGNGVNTPIMSLTYGDSGHQASFGYMEVWGRGIPGGDGVYTADGTRKVRQTMTPPSDVTAHAMIVRGARVSGTAPLLARLETSGGSEVETLSFPAASFAVRPLPTGSSPQLAGMTAIRLPFVSDHVLTGLSAYQVQLSTASGEFWFAAGRKGSSYGYDPATYFPDGHAQLFSGGSWANVKDQSGVPSAEADFQVYLETAAA